MYLSVHEVQDEPLLLVVRLRGEDGAELEANTETIHSHLRIWFEDKSLYSLGIGKIGCMFIVHLL